MNLFKRLKNNKKKANEKMEKRDCYYKCPKCGFEFIQEYDGTDGICSECGELVPETVLTEEQFKIKYDEIAKRPMTEGQRKGVEAAQKRGY